MDTGLKLRELADQQTKKTPTSKSAEVLEFGQLADEVAIAKKAFIDAQTKYELIEANILRIAQEQYANNAKAGCFTKSINFEGSSTSGVQVVYQDRFKPMPTNSESLIKEALGDTYQAYFQESRQLELVDTSDETITKLMRVLGTEEFARLFKIKIQVTTKDNMDQRQFNLPDAVQSVLCQYKASVKVRK